MSQERTEAVVLRGVDFSDTSRIVTVLTPARGRIAVLAKGAKRPKGRWSGVLETFNRLEIVYAWKDGRSVQTLIDASLISDFTNVKRDLDKATYAAWPVELAYRVAHENEPSTALYGALADGLADFDAWTGDALTHCCWQVLRLLTAAGFGPSLDRCGCCGGPVAASPGFSYACGVVCARCASDRTLSAREYSALEALASQRERCPAIEAPRALFALLAAYAQRQLDTGFRSLRVIERMIASTPAT